MNIKAYLNTTKEEVESKKYNIWIGISLGNKYFTKENIKKYIIWALENTKEDVLIVIGDRIHAINIEIISGYNKLRAFKKASQLGDLKEKEIQEILSELPEIKDKVKIARFREVANTKYYEYRYEILLDEFEKNPEFKNKILEIIKESRMSILDKLSNDKIGKLAEYVLRELPLYLNGAYFKDKDNSGKYYDCTIYPGIGLIDFLVVDLQKNKSFPELSKKLKINNSTAILEGYVNNLIEINRENIYINETANRGRSIFAKKDFKKGEIVFKIDGPIVKVLSIYTIPIDDYLFIDPLSMAGKELCHSCEPNCGIKNKVNVVAMKDIKNNEEVTIDYAMIVYDYGKEMTEENRVCKCWSNKCRGKLGAFKELPDNLKKEYNGFISEYLIKKTKRAPNSNLPP